MMTDSKKSLQEKFSEFGCTILNFSDDKIIVDYFYNEEMYEKYMSGVNCRQGMGMYDINQVIEYNRIPDDKMVIIQKDGIEMNRYKYMTIFKATLIYNEKESKKNNKSLTFRIRRNKFGKKLNYIDSNGNSLDFYNINAIKDHLRIKYGMYKITDWSVNIE